MSFLISSLAIAIIIDVDSRRCMNSICFQENNCCDSVRLSFLLAPVGFILISLCNVKQAPVITEHFPQLLTQLELAVRADRHHLQNAAVH